MKQIERQKFVKTYRQIQVQRIIQISIHIVVEGQKKQEENTQKGQENEKQI